MTEVDTAQPFKEIPGPKGSWLLGNYREMSKDQIGFLSNSRDEYGGIVKLRIGPLHAIQITDPEYVKQVFAGNHYKYHKGPDYKFILPLVGNGLLNSEDDFWRKQRRLISPAFHGKQIEIFVADMVKLVNNKIDDWNNQLQNTSSIDVNMHEEMTGLTFQIIAKAMFTTDVSDDMKIISDSMKVTLTQIERRFDSILPIPMWLPTPSNWRFKKALKAINGVAERIINERLKSERGDDLLQVLLDHTNTEGDMQEQEDKMSYYQLFSEVRTILVAGHETTANLLSWAIYFLSEYPDIVTKLQAEVDTVVKDNTLEIKDLSKLTYTSQVIDEVLRLMPPAWAVGRLAIEDDIIGGYEIPKGTIVLVSPYLMGHDPKNWNQPEVFDPDRFLEDNKPNQQSYRYIPFGGGPRICIGRNFSLVEGQIALALFVKNFNFKLATQQPKGIHYQAAVTLRPKNGLFIEITKR